MTDIESIMTIFGYCYNLLNNDVGYSTCEFVCKLRLFKFRLRFSRQSISTFSLAAFCCAIYTLRTTSSSSLQSGNICKSLYSVLYLYYRSALLHMYFYSFFKSNLARSLARSITQRSTDSSSHINRA